MKVFKIQFCCLLLLFNILYASNQFDVAIKKTLQIDKYNNVVKFHHFRFDFKPEFHTNTIVDVHYEITYQVVSKNYKKIWVDLHEGHLVNVSDKLFNTQLKGPFTGIDAVRYKFHFTLKDDSSSPYNKSIKIVVFSSSPKSDAQYYNTNFDQPFKVTAYYKNISTLKNTLEVYSLISNVYTGFKIIRGTIGTVNPPVLMITAGQYVAEAVVIYAIEKHLENLPIRIHLECNHCGDKNVVIKHKFYDFIYKCSECGRKAKIQFLE